MRQETVPSTKGALQWPGQLRDCSCSRLGAGVFGNGRLRLFLLIRRFVVMGYEIRLVGAAVRVGEEERMNSK